ncbi:LIC10280 family protein [Frigidibacter sp. ROC022]|uniref:LIC10280 family protein n=1 Tax=Frigidibacter sp. ROC022 TaxID=2971796 RepID=UPI00215B7462|nr:hypothetical protein [Frigidibacter sp. ROC022]MCR8726253.1 hypothetical protein [Frigidibacter sp. ROC022]
MLARRHILALLLGLAATPTVAQNVQPGPVLQVAGSYTAQGLYPDGTIYSGLVEIAQNGGRVAMTWNIEGETYQGTGLIDGRVMAVDWGDATPIVYIIMPDHELHGTWNDGLALEKLTPR